MESRRFYQARWRFFENKEEMLNIEQNIKNLNNQIISLEEKSRIQHKAFEAGTHERVEANNLLRNIDHKINKIRERLIADSNNIENAILATLVHTSFNFFFHIGMLDNAPPPSYLSNQSALQKELDTLYEQRKKPHSIKTVWLQKQRDLIKLDKKIESLKTKLGYAKQICDNFDAAKNGDSKANYAVAQGLGVGLGHWTTAVDFYCDAIEKNVDEAREKLTTLFYENHTPALIYHAAMTIRDDKMKERLTQLAEQRPVLFSKLAYYDSWEQIEPLLKNAEAAKKVYELRQSQITPLKQEIENGVAENCIIPDVILNLIQEYVTPTWSASPEIKSEWAKQQPIRLAKLTTLFSTATASPPPPESPALNNTYLFNHSLK